MRVVLQRTARAGVTVEGQEIGAIGIGYLLLVGVCNGDDEAVVRRMAEKIYKLRIFPDENGKINRSISDVGGEILVVSQFTLYADCRKGNRPSFTGAGDPELANHLYEYMVECFKTYGLRIAQGSFGADMKVELLNDGPFTLVLDSSEL